VSKMQELKTKMQNERLKLKEEFRQRVYKFALDIIEFIEQLPKEQTSRIIGDQLLRSATSVGANVAEAQGAVSKKDYTNFFAHALKSANETKFWLSLLQDSGKSRKISKGDKWETSKRGG
jgi:four helix bundle protein